MHYGHVSNSYRCTGGSCYGHESQKKEKQDHLEEKYAKITVIVKDAEGVNGLIYPIIRRNGRLLF